MKDFLEIGKKVVLLDEANKSLDKLIKKFGDFDINGDFNSIKLSIVNKIDSLEGNIYIISHRMMREARGNDITRMSLMNCLVGLKKANSSDAKITILGILKFIKDREIAELAFMKNSLNLFEKSSFAAFKVGNLANMDIDSISFSIKEREIDIEEISEFMDIILKEL